LTRRRAVLATGCAGRVDRGWGDAARSYQLDEEGALLRQRGRRLGQHKVEQQPCRVEEQRGGDAEPGRMALPLALP
jgi:hypothetical protein